MTNLDGLPQGWVSLPLADAVRPRGEKASPQDFPDYPFLGMDHVEAQTGRIIGQVSAGSMKSAAARFRAGDVLYGRLRPYLNKVARPSFDGLASAEFMVFPENGFVLNSYLMHRLRSRDFVSFSSHLNEGDRPRVDFNQIGAFSIEVPPLPEQHRIVAKIEALFSELDAGQDSLTRAQAQLKLYRQSLLKAAFRGRLTADWRKANPDKLEDPETLLARIRSERDARYKQALDDWQTALTEWRAGGEVGRKPAKPTRLEDAKIATEEMGQLPHGWVAIQIAALCEVVRGGSPRPAGDPRFYGGDIPFLKVADLTRTSGMSVTAFTYTITEAGLTKTRLTPAGTLMISNSGATLGVPKICDIEATFNDGIAAFLGLSDEEQEYHYYFWESKTADLRGLNQGAAQPNLNTGILSEMPIPLCHPSEMREVTRRLSALMSQVDAMETEITTALAKLSALRQSILKKAFSGQLVPQDPADEPAAALLSRLRDAAPTPRRKTKA